MISLWETELYLILLYWDKASSSSEMIAVKLLSTQDPQIK